MSGLALFVAKPGQNIIPVLPLMFDSAHHHAMATPAVPVKFRRSLYHLLSRPLIAFDICLVICSSPISRSS